MTLKKCLNGSNTLKGYIHVYKFISLQPKLKDSSGGKQYTKPCKYVHETKTNLHVKTVRLGLHTCSFCTESLYELAIK